ncbi:hypothetical protein os4_30330 [Comamonadaceae bacterium OS-4]|nr:hypothetical protein os4_30330 [Comamonadaceae bacterium OS-4]
MAKRIQNASDLNTGIVSFIQGIIKIGASSKGNAFDETVRSLLLKELSGAVLIDDKRWGSKSSTSIFREYRKRSMTKNFDFTDLQPIVDNTQPLDLIIVDKPNGSQNWPDLLIIYNQIGLPIEVKSTENDSIVWNSGFPRFDGIYIFNCYGKSTTTCFLGQHAINKFELDELKTSSKEASQHNKKCGGTRWSYYVRDMYNSSQSFIESKSLPTELIKLGNDIKEAESKLKCGCTTSGKNLTFNQIEALKVSIEEKTEKFIALDNEFNRQKHRREEMERETIEFIQKLPWTTNQNTDFDPV